MMFECFMAITTLVSNIFTSFSIKCVERPFKMKPLLFLPYSQSYLIGITMKQSIFCVDLEVLNTPAGIYVTLIHLRRAVTAPGTYTLKIRPTHH